MRELYESGLTNSELIERLKLFGIGRRTIYADSAEPARIKEIYRAGFDIRPANKSVPDGIDCMKRRPMFIRKECPNTIKEIQGYVWKKDKNGNLLDEPVKFNDHAMDAARYAILSDWESKRGGYQRLMVR
jgi:phage terminase large subunit